MSKIYKFMQNAQKKVYQTLRKDFSWCRIFIAASMIFVFSLCNLPVFALEEDITEVNTDVQTVEEIREVVEYNIQLNEPITTIQVDPIDYYNEQNPVPYITGSAYQGSFNSTALNYFTGVMLNNVGMDYVAFRGSQYMYYLYFGDDISYSGVFNGSSLNYVSYNAQYGTISRGIDNLDIAPGATIVYSNVDNSFANFVEVKTVEEIRSQGIITASIFLLISVLWFFKH